MVFGLTPATALAAGFSIGGSLGMMGALLLVSAAIQDPGQHHRVGTITKWVGILGGVTLGVTLWRVTR